MKILKYITLLLLYPSLTFGLEIDLSDIPTGQIRTAEWGSIPILIYKRTPKDIEYLKTLPDTKYDGAAIGNALYGLARTYGNEQATLIGYGIRSIKDKKYRSISDDLFVSILPTIKGCLLEKKSTTFYDPCNSIFFDPAGRIILNPENIPEVDLLPPLYEIRNNKLYIYDSVKGTGKEIIDFSPEIKGTSGIDLIEAIQWRKYDRASEILKANPSSVNYQNNMGTTPLHVAASIDKKLVELLVASGANVNAYTYSGYLPLHFSSLVWKEDISTYLIKSGAKLQVCNNGKCTIPLEPWLRERFSGPMQSKVESYISRVLKQSSNKCKQQDC